MASARPERRGGTCEVAGASFRDLNSELKLQDNPNPLTVEALDRLSSGEGCQTLLFLSTLDLALGFGTLPIKWSDKGLTEFVTHRQKYEFNCLPFMASRAARPTTRLHTMQMRI